MLYMKRKLQVKGPWLKVTYLQQIRKVNINKIAWGTFSFKAIKASQEYTEIILLVTPEQGWDGHRISIYQEKVRTTDQRTQRCKRRTKHKQTNQREKKPLVNQYNMTIKGSHFLSLVLLTSVLTHLL